MKKKKYIAPKIREISLSKLMDHTENVTTASHQDHTVDAKRVGWDDDIYDSFPDSNYYNLWDDTGWK